MKRLLYIWFTFVLLAALGVGCSHGGGDAELVAIDSLIAASPDSALAALGRIDTAALGEGDRAYHALLTVQARFLAGHPATDSAGICRAWRWYAHHGPTDRQLRAMRYRATVAEEMGDPETAMRWYKRTELAAREQGDDEAAAYALMSMGALYQRHFQNTHATDKYRQCVEMLPEADSASWLFVNLQLAQLYRTTNRDSSRHFARIVTEHALPLGDRLSYGVARSLDVATLFYDRRYQACLAAAQDVLAGGNAAVEPEVWYMAAICHAKLGAADSARRVFNQSPPPVTNGDTILWLRAQEALSELDGDLRQSKAFANAASNHSGETLVRSVASNLPAAEAAVAAEVRGSQVWHRAYGIIVAAAIAFMAVALWFVFRFVIPKRRFAKDLADLNQTVQRLEKQEKELTKERDRLRSQLKNDEESKRRLEQVEGELSTSLQRNSEQEEWISALAESIASTSEALQKFIDGCNNAFKDKQFDEKVFTEMVLTPEFFQVLRAYVDSTHHNLAAQLASRPDISDRDVNVICMHLCGISNGFIRIYTKQSNNHSVTNLKDIVAKKFFGPGGRTRDFTNY